MNMNGSNTAWGKVRDERILKAHGGEIHYVKTDSALAFLVPDALIDRMGLLASLGTRENAPEGFTQFGVVVEDETVIEGTAVGLSFPEVEMFANPITQAMAFAILASEKPDLAEAYMSQRIASDNIDRETDLNLN